jgi:pyridoxal phosphate enzyme (YggS family)
MRLMNEQQLTDNIAKVRSRVRESAEKCQRQESAILLLAVSKTRTAEDIRAAAGCGLRHFGENYLQEALDKIARLQDLDLVWHFIGPIQSNKTRPIATHFDWVHSVDRAKIARRLNDQRPDGLAPLNICLQVNISGEDSKSGIKPAELPAMVQALAQLPRLRLRGLMAIPAATDDVARQHANFSQLRELLDEVRDIAAEADTLSMGMSADMEAAIAEGATIVRIGTDIFGPRA